MRRAEESPQTGEERSTKVEARSLQMRQDHAEESVRESATHTTSAHVLADRAIDSAVTLIPNLRQPQTCGFCEEVFPFEGTVL